MDEIRDDQEALAARLASVQGLIVFDGCAGVGKTYLAGEMARRLGGEAIDVDLYLNRDQGCFVAAIHFKELRTAVLTASKRTPRVFMSAVCGREIVERLGVPAAVHVYIEQHSSMDNVANLEILDAENGTPEALAERPESDLLGCEIFDYHAAFKPRRAADIVYIRTAD